MTYWKPIIAIILALSLTGCAGTLAQMSTDAAYLHAAGSNYVREVHAYRLWVRGECHDMLKMEVDALKADGEYGEARSRLSANYPGLVTLDIISDFEDDPGSVLSEPFGCE